MTLQVELKTSAKDYVKGSDGIHFKFRTNSEGTKILQLVIGEAKIKNDLKDGIDEAFKSITKYLSENTQDRNLLDTHLMEQLVDKDEAKLIKEYIMAIPRKKKETVFGIFIGYNIDYKGVSDTNDEFDRKVIEENIKQVLSFKNHIINTINSHHSAYESLAFRDCK